MAPLKIPSGQNGSAVVLAILVIFVCSSMGLVMMQVRRDLEKRSLFDPDREGEHAAWVGIENFFRDNAGCSQMLRKKRLGDTLVGQVGKEWDQSGWIVKDMYVLRREDEVAWQVPQSPSTVFVKVSLVPKPAEGIKAGVEYLLHAPTTTRLIAVKARLAHERIFGDCKKSRAEEACYRVARARDTTPIISAAGRMPASASLSCLEGRAYQIQCLIPERDAPIWSCVN